MGLALQKNKLETKLGAQVDVAVVGVSNMLQKVATVFREGCNNSIGTNAEYAFDGSGCSGTPEHRHVVAWLLLNSR